MQARGYQGLRIKDVLKKANCTQGGLYHHFKNKEELGIAVIDEVIMARLQTTWLETLGRHDNPVDGVNEALVKMAEQYEMNMITLGCPINNLAQEMSPINEKFRTHINHLFHLWHKALMDLLQRGINSGMIDGGHNPRAMATFILSVMEGAIGLAKNEGSIAPFIRSMDEVEKYLQCLAPAGNGQ
jgi:AcrR family transcriptional regulator